MTRWQAVNQNGRREKGKKRLQWGIFLISLFPAQSGTQTTRAGGMAQLMLLLSALDCGETDGRPQDCISGEGRGYLYTC